MMDDKRTEILEEAINNLQSTENAVNHKVYKKHETAIGKWIREIIEEGGSAVNSYGKTDNFIQL